MHCFVFNKAIPFIFLIMKSTYLRILASVSFLPLLIIESVARVSQHVLFMYELPVKQV